MPAKQKTPVRRAKKANGAPKKLSHFAAEKDTRMPIFSWSKLVGDVFPTVSLLLKLGLAGLILIFLLSVSGVLQGLQGMCLFNCGPPSHNHKEFIVNFSQSLMNVSVWNNGASFRDLAQLTRGAVAVVSTSITGIRTRTNLDPLEIALLEQADKVVERLATIELRTRDMAVQNHQTFISFGAELTAIAVAYREGRTSAVLNALTHMEEAIANALQEISKLQMLVSRTTDDTEALRDQAVACMHTMSQRAQDSAGKVVYPPTTIALASLTASLVTFTAVSFAPVVVAAGFGAGQAGVGVGALVGLIGLDKQAKQEYESQKMSEQAKQLETFALGTQTIMQGISRLNQSLGDIRGRIKNSLTAASDLKGAAHEEDVRQFTGLVDKARNQFATVEKAAKKLLVEWANEN